MTNKKNTNPIEIIEVGNKGLEDLFKKAGDRLWGLRPSYLPDTARNQYFSRAIEHIIHDDKLKPLLGSKQGLFSIYQKVSQAIELGLTIGGFKPQVYLTAFSKKNNTHELTLIPSADGYSWIVTTGQNPLFSKVDCRVVHMNDIFDIDIAEGKITHKLDVKQSRGDLLGCYVKCTYPNGDMYVDWVELSEIHKIRDNHSASYKAYINPKLDWIKTTPWITDAEEMYKKTAMKKVLKQFISKCEGLANLYQYETQGDEQIKDINLRADHFLDDKKIVPGDVLVEEKEKEPIKEDNGHKFF